MGATIKNFKTMQKTASGLLGPIDSQCRQKRSDTFNSLKTTIFAMILIVPMSVLAEGERKDRKIPDEYLAKKNPFTGSDKSVFERGEYIFSKKCARCHGKNGDGVGSILEGYQMPVFNKEYYSKREDGYIFWIVEHGLPNTPMRPFGPGSDYNLSEADIWKVIAYEREKFGK
ncbi:MAG: c-type cytochrome [Candidatus Brocadia sp.]|nr:c-type cytochrome [Candidatus Brocadia sp.]